MGWCMRLEEELLWGLVRWPFASCWPRRCRPRALAMAAGPGSGQLRWQRPEVALSYDGWEILRVRNFSSIVLAAGAGRDLGGSAFSFEIVHLFCEDFRRATAIFVPFLCYFDRVFYFRLSFVKPFERSSAAGSLAFRGFGYRESAGESNLHINHHLLNLFGKIK
ncbi:hypothetical protein Taro_016576 [Colocasia esculenta]|uniref:Uncharacterized protein n=1 Tax=Colocasia esculenta TaxID=4460 RepID=A0A843UQN8_COLES|nr:hypothetical protein [Colocasia esculenta]